MQTCLEVYFLSYIDFLPNIYVNFLNWIFFSDNLVYLKEITGSISGFTSGFFWSGEQIPWYIWIGCSCPFSLFCCVLMNKGQGKVANCVPARIQDDSKVRFQTLGTGFLYQNKKKVIWLCIQNLSFSRYWKFIFNIVSLLVSFNT